MASKHARSCYRGFLRHGVKVVPGGLGTVGPGTRQPNQDLKVGRKTPLKFKSGTPGLPSKFKSWIPIIIFLHCLTYFVLGKYVYNMEIIFHE